ncbi:MAG: ECF-type sigma factor [Pirellulaceae bacterium]
MNTDVSKILFAIESGDRQAVGQLLPLIYEELRRLASSKMIQRKSGQTLQPTALVHEAFLRLVGGKDRQSWDGRGHFFAAAAEAMRRILIDNALGVYPRTTKHNWACARAWLQRKMILQRFAPPVYFLHTIAPQ